MCKVHAKANTVIFPPFPGFRQNRSDRVTGNTTHLARAGLTKIAVDKGIAGFRNQHHAPRRSRRFPRFIRFVEGLASRCFEYASVPAQAGYLSPAPACRIYSGTT